MDPTNAVYFCNRAAAKSKLNKHHDVIDDCNTALKLDPTYSKAYGRLGYAYSALNQLENARNSYLKALELEPDNENYKTNLNLCNEQIQRKEIGQPDGAQDSTNRPGGGGFSDQNLPFEFAAVLNAMDNPAVISMASQLLYSPAIQNLVNNSGLANNGVEALLNASRQFVQQMHDDNTRRGNNPPGPNENNSPHPPPDTEGAQ